MVHLTRHLFLNPHALHQVVQRSQQRGSAVFQYFRRDPVDTGTLAVSQLSNCSLHLIKCRRVRPTNIHLVLLQTVQVMAVVQGTLKVFSPVLHYVCSLCACS
ncbi:unnamed protein product, partial [Dicrocoelium dendriticum]